MASVPKLSMVATAEDVALAVHEYLGSKDCFHDAHSSYKMCEGIAEDLCDYEDGVVKSGVEFLDSLKTNTLVLRALKKQLSFVWDQGWVSGKAGTDIMENPYADSGK